jgi:hypothetical protein
LIFELPGQNSFVCPILQNTSYYGYKSKRRKLLKNNLKLNTYVQDHHIIPKQWKNHKLLQKINYNINSANNIIMMPNKIAYDELNLSSNKLIHDGGHTYYNMYVKQILDHILQYYYYDEEYQIYQFNLFLYYLKDNLVNNEDNIPWN